MNEDLAKAIKMMLSPLYPVAVHPDRVMIFAHPKTFVVSNGVISYSAQRWWGNGEANLLEPELARIIPNVRIWAASPQGTPASECFNDEPFRTNRMWVGVEVRTRLTLASLFVSSDGALVYRPVRYRDGRKLLITPRRELIITQLQTLLDEDAEAA